MSQWSSKLTPRRMGFAIAYDFFCEAIAVKVRQNTNGFLSEGKRKTFALANIFCEGLNGKLELFISLNVDPAYTIWTGLWIHASILGCFMVHTLNSLYQYYYRHRIQKRDFKFSTGGTNE
ncbi:hypothetical protein EDC96DRAFT_570377 [Choanephora cucurbitarum]|nr:hypothetical protein EDC96DRAFT_570377 [Choanephora cucurbitarum]